MSMNKYTKPKKVFDLNIVKPGEFIVIREFDISGNCTTRKGIIKEVKEETLYYGFYNPMSTTCMGHGTLNLKDLWTGGPTGIEFDIVEEK